MRMAPVCQPVRVPGRPDFVEHFSYQQGLLISYWDTSQSDNNTSEHPGQGLVLPIDAHPEPLIRLDGQPWRSRVQVFDAPFSKLDAPSFTLHLNGEPQNIKGQPANPFFSDVIGYYRPATTPNIGPVLPKAGVTMTVKKQQGTSMTVEIGTPRA
jgi:immune inhibitor A